MTVFSRRHVLGAAGALAATTTFGPEVWAQARDRLVIGMSLEPPVLDPTKNAAAAIRSITSPSIYESLGRINRTGAIQPNLAESWTISPDGKEYTFKLRAGVKFHDGEAFDASVAKASIERLFAADSTVPAKSLFTDIDKVEAVDATTLKVTLKSPNSFMLYNLSLGDAGIMHPKSAATNDKKPVGTGPFMFKERKEGDSVTIERFEGYRDLSNIKLKTIVFKVVKDPSAQVNAVLAGDVDTIPGFQAPELVDRLKKDARFAVVVGTTEGEVIMATNNGKKPFNDPKVRQAMAHALNREELISAQQGLRRPYQDLSVRYRQGQGAAGRGGLPQRLRRHAEAAAGGLRPACRRSAGEPARQDRHQGDDQPAAVATVACRGLQGAQLRPHGRGAHRSQRPRSLCPRWLLLGLRFGGLQGQVARGRGDHRLRQARPAPEGSADHHRQGRRQRLPLPARQDRRVEEGADRHVGERSFAVGRFPRHPLEMSAPPLARRGEVQ
jgi:ABC-type transport system substrate-binding protein